MILRFKKQWNPHKKQHNYDVYINQVKHAPFVSSAFFHQIIQSFQERYRNRFEIERLGKTLFTALLESKKQYITATVESLNIEIDLTHTLELAAVPFESMHTGNFFLCERHAVYRVYSESSPPEPISYRDINLVINPVADPKLDENLSHIKSLKKSVQQLNPPYILSPQFSQNPNQGNYDYILNHVSRSDIFYLFTHGELDSDPIPQQQLQFQDGFFSIQPLCQKLKGSHLVYFNTCYSGWESTLQLVMESGFQFFIGNLYKPSISLIRPFAEYFFNRYSLYFNTGEHEHSVMTPRLFYQTRAYLINQLPDEEFGALLSVVMYQKKEPERIHAWSKTLKNPWVALVGILFVLIPLIVVLLMFSGNEHRSHEPSHHPSSPILSFLVDEEEKELMKHDTHSHVWVYKSAHPMLEFMLKICNYPFCNLYLFSFTPNAALNLLMHTYCINPATNIKNECILLPNLGYLTLEDANTNEYMILLSTRYPLDQRKVKAQLEHTLWELEQIHTEMFWQTLIESTSLLDKGSRPIRWIQEPHKSFQYYMLEISNTD